MPKDDEYGTRVNVFVMQNEIYISMRSHVRVPANLRERLQLRR